ncbi:hypothetical protein PISL3812_07630 [Talaromyces islandicus]|uniref:Uncharacterized protein n=1 Tax=Talaromyces islandicus TaxID=28573 RepID=A0A0U1M6M4_TALIS|nr:hypothetical protein PISL3812_07630 [Talaromyces islandicus]
MAKADYGQAMMQLCLDNHGNINHRMPVMARYESDEDNGFSTRSNARRMAGKDKYSNQYYTYTTPLLMFLDSIESFNSPNRPDPVKGLIWLLEQGAHFPADDPRELHPRFVEWHRHEYVYDAGGSLGGYGFMYRKSPTLHHRKCASVPTAVEILLDKWGLKKFSEPNFAEIIKLLIHHGVARGHVARLLIKYDSLYYYLPVSSSTKEKEKAEFGQVSLVTMLLETLKNPGGNSSVTSADDPDNLDDIDNVLSAFIISKARSWLSSPPLESSYMIIERLIKAGANINALIPLRGMHPYGVPVLHRICADTNSLRRSRPELPHDPWLSTTIFPNLVKNGADPMIPAGDDGKTAVEALVANLDQLQEADKDYLNSLGALLKQLHEKYFDT